MEQELGREREDRLNLKVGRGGVVDGEFAVQDLQLLQGGSRPTVRARGTLKALYELQRAGIVTLEQNLGALSGAFTVPKVTTCETSGGTYTDVTVVAGALGTTQNALTAITFDASQAKKFIKDGATVGTSALISATLSGFQT